MNPTARTLPEPTTIGELLQHLESYQYSHEYMDIMKESYELSMMEKMIEAKIFMSENSELITESTKNGYYTEAFDINEGFLVMVEGKQEGILARVWAAIKKFFRWIGNAFARLFGAKTSEKIAIENLDLGNDDLARDVTEVLEELQNSILRITDSKNKKGVRFSYKIGDRKEVIRRAVKFVNEGKLKLALPEHCSPTNFTTIGAEFNAIRAIMDRLGTGKIANKKEIEALNKHAQQALASIEAVSKSMVGKEDIFSLDQAATETAKLAKFTDMVKVDRTGGYTDKSDEAKKKKPELAYKTGEGTNLDKKMQQFGENNPEVGKAIAALNELNGKWAKMCKEVLQVYTEILKFQKKAADVLKKYQDAGAGEKKSA